jgi:hypothetical protein
LIFQQLPHNGRVSLESCPIRRSVRFFWDAPLSLPRCENISLYLKHRRQSCAHILGGGPTRSCRTALPRCAGCRPSRLWTMSSGNRRRSLQLRRAPARPWPRRSSGCAPFRSCRNRLTLFPHQSRNRRPTTSRSRGKVASDLEGSRARDVNNMAVLRSSK